MSAFGLKRCVRFWFEAGCVRSWFEAVCPLLIFDSIRDGMVSLQGLAVSIGAPASRHGSSRAFESYIVHQWSTLDRRKRASLRKH